ncbi:hypothetical protein [Bacillus sonorensis]|uniref:hypothetical protein n=1 Tax=Bacillus sonorensis TaxID=119858 RepID=UPI002A6AA196|nr:hypothetical protein [Bacillus sonorensis]WPP39264.1 hypothetical protein SK061_24895 [Bacillus sonorensis]
MIKKCINSIVALGLFTTLFAVSPPEKASAAESKTVYSAKEETNLDVLYEKARSGQTDLLLNSATEKKFSTKGQLNGADQDVKVENFSTSQLLEIKRDGKKVIQSYATTSFAEPKIQKKTSGEFTTADSQGKSKWDTSIGVKAYSTIYWDIEYDGNNKEYYKFKKMTGGWTREDKSISLSKRTVHYGANGSARGKPWVTQRKTAYPTKNTFTINPPKSWHAITKSYTGSLGGTSKVTLKRRSSTWTLQLTNDAWAS